MRHSTEIQAPIGDFTAGLVAAAEAEAPERVRSVVASALALQPSHGPGSRLRSPSEGTPAGNVRGPLRLSAKTLAVRKLHDQCLGTLRRLAPPARERVGEERGDEEGHGCSGRVSQGARIATGAAP